MNDLLLNKCKTPAFFSSVKYVVHTLDDDEKMANLIMEICEINPYLGVDIYITSEENIGIRKQLELCLHQIPEKTILIKIQLSLAWFLLGNHDESLKACKRIFYSDRVDRKQKSSVISNVCEINPFWKNLLYEMVLTARYIEVWPKVFKLFYLDHGNFELAEKDKMIEMLQEAYDAKDYGRFLVAVDSFGLYGMIDPIVKNFSDFYEKVFDLYINGKLKYAINYKQEFNPFAKLTVIYLMRGNDGLKLLNTIKKHGGKYRIRAGGQPLYFLINHYIYNFYSFKKEIRLSPLLARMWSSELNGIPYPIKGLTRDYMESWWQGKCGHVWRRNIKLMQKNTKCPFCKKGVLDNE